MSCTVLVLTAPWWQHLSASTSLDFHPVLWYLPAGSMLVSPARKFLMQTFLLAISAGPSLFLWLFKMMDILNSWLNILVGILQIKKGWRQSIISQQAGWDIIVSSTLLQASIMHLLHNKARANINSCYQKGAIPAIIRHKLLMGCVIELQTSKEKHPLWQVGVGRDEIIMTK